jgi:RNA polymerase sigma-70 factor (ECF subfamily)
VVLSERGQGRDREPGSPGVPGETDLDRERRLLARARQGDPHSYGDLVRSHQDRIYGLIFRLVRDPGLAEELTQDAFLRAYRNLDRFRGEARFATWMYRIAVNLCHDHRDSRAAQGRSKERSLDDPDWEGLQLPTRNSQPDLVVEVVEVAKDFQAGLDALEPKYREAFLLRHQEGLGYDEIASILEISKANAKVRVHRAREAILDSLRERGYEV